jgi:tRNA-modifying protein YgfZ
MAAVAFAFLPLLDRGVVSVTGVDAVSFLDNLATNALDDMKTGDAKFAALLTPQGKIQFEFFALRTTEGFLLETHKDKTAELVKRLTLYKLRAKVTIKDEAFVVAASPEISRDRLTPGFIDPRDAALGYRLLSRDTTLHLAYDAATAADYHRHRIAHGVPEAGLDYALGDTFPHEANYDRLHGVSFSKGCFVGQEVVSRMQNKTVVRKRVVKVTGVAALTAGAPVLVGEAEIGRIGSVDGVQGLAMLRLDRALEAADIGQTLSAGGVALRVDAEALAAYKKSVADKPVIDL